jgi:crotonobetainyl-CoA:carnitine CoA-transferase CaiB-like acyl-CoA transferase
MGVLAALRHRERTGAGQRVEVSLLSSLLSALTNQASAYVAGGVVPQAMGNRHPSIAPYEVVDAKDRPLALAVGTDRQFASLSAELGLPELAEDPRFATNPARVAHRAELLAALEGPLRTRPADAWFEALTAVGVPCGPINDLAAAFEFADRLGLDARVTIDDPRRDTPVEQVANPIRLGATPATYRSSPPRLGEHTHEVLAELDLPSPNDVNA